jgi:hypothetical protein
LHYSTHTDPLSSTLSSSFFFFSSSNSVVSVLKAWLEKFFRDFEDDPSLRQEMLDFARNDIEPKIPIAARQLEKALSKNTQVAVVPLLGIKYLAYEHDNG